MVPEATTVLPNLVTDWTEAEQKLAQSYPNGLVFLSTLLEYPATFYYFPQRVCTNESSRSRIRTHRDVE